MSVVTEIGTISDTERRSLSRRRPSIPVELFFLRFLNDIDVNLPRGFDVNLVMDNYVNGRPGLRCGAVPRFSHLIQWLLQEKERRTSPQC